MQPEFAIKLAQLSKESGLNVTVETCGFCKTDIFEKINKYTDCFLFDYKCNPADYKKYTGVSFDLIEKNLEYVSHNSKRVVLRCPIVPDCIRQSHFDEIGMMMIKHGIKEAELLPYHNLGISKSERFGMLKQSEFKSVDKEKLAFKAREISVKYKVQVKLG